MFSIFNRLFSFPPNVFSLHLNQKHLQECVDQLCFLYSELEERNRELLFSTSWFEIEALHVLISSDVSGLYKALQLSPYAKSQDVLKYSIEISSSLWFGNFVRATRLSTKLPVLLQLAYGLKFHTLRPLVVEIIEHSHRSAQGTKFPLNKLAHYLLFDTEKEAAEYCCDLGLFVDNSTSSVIFKTGTPLKSSGIVQCHSLSNRLFTQCFENVRVSEWLHGRSI